MTENVTGTVTGVLDHIAVGGVGRNRIARMARLFEFDRMQSSERGWMQIAYCNSLMREIGTRYIDR